MAKTNRRALYDKNHRYLAKHWPTFKAIAPYLNCRPELIIEDQITGSAENLIFGQNLVYQIKASDFVQLQLQQVLAENAIFFDGITMITDEDIPTHFYGQKLDQLDGANLVAKPKVQVSLPTQFATQIACFGIGLGLHLKPAAALFKPKRLIVFETEPQLLSAAMCVIDFEELKRDLRKIGTELLYGFGVYPEPLAFAMLNELRYVSIALVPGIRFYVHHRIGNMGPLVAKFQELIPLLPQPIGYFHDQQRQITQSIENIYATSNLLSKRLAVTPGTSVAVIAAGPSLNKSIEIAKALYKRVPIISCGTALKVLLANDIIPDYHVEIETHPTTIDFIQEYWNEQTFSQITLIATTGIFPGITKLFKNTILYLRANVAATDLFYDLGQELPHSLPRVGNAAAALAVFLGIENVYMLGMDNGYREGEASHARGTIYETAISDKQNDDLAEQFDGIAPHLVETIVDPRSRAKVAVKSILEGQLVYMDQLFSMALNQFIELAARNPTQRIYQIGYGAYIDGAVNLLPEQFDPSSVPTMPKPFKDLLGESLADINQVYPIYKSNILKATQILSMLVNKLKKAVANTDPNISSFHNLTMQIHQILVKNEGANYPEIVLIFNGSAQNFCKLISERYHMHTDDPQKKRFLKLSLQILGEWLDAVDLMFSDNMNQTFGRLEGGVRDSQ